MLDLSPFVYHFAEIKVITNRLFHSDVNLQVIDFVKINIRLFSVKNPFEPMILTSIHDLFKYYNTRNQTFIVS